MDIEIRLFEPHMGVDLCEFVKLCYGPSYWMLDRKYFDWWYKESPSNWEDRYRFVVGLLNGKIVGFEAQIANTFRIKGKTYRGTWYSNGMVHPDYRGMGIGKKVYVGAMQFTNVAGVVSYNDPAQTLLRAAGFETFGKRSMERALYLLNPDAVEKHLPHSDDTAFRQLKGTFTRRVDPSNLGFVRQMDRVTPAFSTLWAEVKDRYTVTTERTPEHITWRYFRHPRGVYHILAHFAESFQERLLGVAVMRFESTPPLRVARLADVWGHPAAIEPLLRGVVSFAARGNAILVDFFCSGWPDREAFQQAGFVILGEQEASVVPYLFSPLKVRQQYEEPIGICAKDPALIQGLAFEDIYFVRGDGDRDRPQ